jgi:hypothetical protein
MSKKDEKQSKENSTQNGWGEYRNAVIENKNKSQDDFEKYINLLASGGIIISLTFLEKITAVVKIVYIIFYLLGLFLLVLTLITNLYSHHKSIQDSDSIIKEIDEEKYEDIFKNIEKRNKPINLLNKTSIWSLIIGTILILTFVSINLFAMNENQKPSPSDHPRQNPKPITEEKRGRTNPTPPRTNPSSTPKK